MADLRCRVKSAGFRDLRQSPRADVNVAHPLDAARPVRQTTVAPGSQPPVLDATDHHGKAVPINLSEELPAGIDAGKGHHMPNNHSVRLYEVEKKGSYHEHWLAHSPLDAARRAFSHAQELDLALDRVDVSSMVPPEDQAKGGLVYVLNDTRNYAVVDGRVRRSESLDEPRTQRRGEQLPPVSHPSTR